MTDYTEKILKYATDTTRTGELPDADGVGEVGLGAEEAGRRLAVRFMLRTQNGTVADARFQVFGCGFTIAACAAAAELSIGHPLEEVSRLDAGRVNAALGGLPAERDYCAELAVEALQAAVRSARSEDHAVQQAIHHPEEHGPRVTVDDPLYRALMATPKPSGVAAQDRHLFACLLAVAAREPCDLAAALGLVAADIDAILMRCFPAFDSTQLADHSNPAHSNPPEVNGDVLKILLTHVPLEDSGRPRVLSVWLARAIAARAARPGHLWTAMGLFERPQLSAAIRRHLPSLAEANDQNMRWKRFLYKQVCDLNGGAMCKSPNCGVCSDYAICFPAEEEGTG